MTSINEKMGFKRAGKRAMMKLPTNRELRSRITSARCPLCHQTGATLSRVQPGALFCTHCSHTWPLGDGE